MRIDSYASVRPEQLKVSAPMKGCGARSCADSDAEKRPGKPPELVLGESEFAGRMHSGSRGTAQTPSASVGLLPSTASRTALQLALWRPMAAWWTPVSHACNHHHAANLFTCDHAFCFKLKLGMNQCNL